MKATENKDRDRVFEARVGLGLRELDGIERAPDVSAEVSRRLQDHELATERSPVRWLAVAAAVLAIGVTTALLVMNRNEGSSGDLATAVAPQDPQGTQDPVGPWRLVYELPLDELQRSLRDNQNEDLEQLLARSVRNVEARIGAVAGAGVKVTRGDATTFTVAFANAAAGDVERVRILLENPGRLEMRAVADGDYAAPDLLFDMPKERKQLQAWLDRGGSPDLSGYRAASEHLRWFVHLVRPSASQAGRWDVRFADVPALGDSTVAAHAEADWNGGTIPAHIQARPVEERFLVEWVAVNMFEQHFRETDLDPAGVEQTTDRSGRAAVDYRMRPEKQGEYADFSEFFLNKCCAIIFNDEVMTAPRFESRIPGVGRISGLSEWEATAIAGTLSTPLAAKPRLLHSEPDKPR